MPHLWGENLSPCYPGRINFSSFFLPNLANHLHENLSRLEWWSALPGNPFSMVASPFLAAPTFLHITRSRRVNQSTCERSWLRQRVQLFFLSNKRWGCLPAFGTGEPYQSSVKKNSTIYLDYYAKRVWGQVNFRKGFWVRYWRRAGQLLANFSTVPSHRPRSLCERHSRNEEETEPS